MGRTYQLRYNDVSQRTGLAVMTRGLSEMVWHGSPVQVRVFLSHSNRRLCLRTRSVSLRDMRKVPGGIDQPSELLLKLLIARIIHEHVG